MINALAPTLFFAVERRFSNMGMRKAADLPLPVRAMATTSLLSKITGIVYNNVETVNVS